MKIVDTFTQKDFDALVAAGMDVMNEPLQQEVTFIRSVRFEISDEVYNALDLNNRHDVTIQTVLPLRFEHNCYDCDGRGHDLHLSTCFTCSGSGKLTN